MKYYFLFCLGLLLVSCSENSVAPNEPSKPKPSKFTVSLKNDIDYSRIPPGWEVHLNGFGIIVKMGNDKDLIYVFKNDTLVVFENADFLAYKPVFCTSIFSIHRNYDSTRYISGKPREYMVDSLFSTKVNEFHFVTKDF